MAARLKPSLSFFCGTFVVHIGLFKKLNKLYKSTVLNLGVTIEVYVRHYEAREV